MKYKEQKLGRPRKGVFIKPLPKGFPAKYPGTCIICKEKFLEGTMIRKYAYGQVYHVECIREK